MKVKMEVVDSMYENILQKLAGLVVFSLARLVRFACCNEYFL